MKIRPYLTFDGNAEEAINLYKEAFKTDTIDLMRFSDIPGDMKQEIPEEFMDRILQARMKFGNDFIRISDCGPGAQLNDPESERISLAIETDKDSVSYAFDILAKEGRIGMPLAKTFYSPLAGVVFDKFGVMWNFVAQEEVEDKKEKKVSKKAQHRWSKDISKMEFYVDTRDSKGTIIWQKRNEMLLKAGATMMKEAPLNKDGSIGFSAKVGSLLREENEDKIKNYVTTEDIILKSVNEVGLFLYFAGTNSWLEFINKDGQTIDELTRVDK